MSHANHLAIVGDVHGDSRALERALDDLHALPGKVIFVGDYVNRGPDSKGVLDLLVQASRSWEEDLTLLLGNHERVLIDFLETGDTDALIRHAGLSTIRSYLGPGPGDDPFAQFRRHFPRNHRELLDSMKPYYETETLLVSHSGFNPQKPHSREDGDVIFGNFPQLFDRELSVPKELVVCGHYIQRNQSPYVSPRFICLDTGCGATAGAPLTALLLPEREIRTYQGTT